MEKIEILTEVVKKLEEIQDKYDIFFRVHNNGIWDYFELDFNPYATLRIKETGKLPFTLINDVKREFPLLEM
jgi:hypothetical protein